VRTVGIRHLPLLSPAATAVADVQTRYWTRSVRGRLAMVFPGAIMVLFGFLSRRIPDEIPFGTLVGTHGHVLFAFGLLFSVYVLQAFHLNQFASDRAGLSLLFLAPVSDADLVRGKAVAGGVLLGITALLCLACAALTVPGTPIAIWLAVFLAGFATYGLLAPLGAVLSALFPQAADLNTTGTSGSPHGLSIVLGLALTAVLAAPAVLIVGIGYHAGGRPFVTLGAMAIWAVVCIAVGAKLLDAAARFVAARRENLALVARER
jgi:hypothetical protein